MMSSAIYYRLCGQAVTIAVHSVNSVTMFLSMQNEDLMKDPEIRTMTSMQSRFLTVWNIGFQLAYFSLAFLCDILTVTGRDHMIPKSIRRFRQAFFATTAWPTAWLIFIIFWPIFLANRELLFPAFIDNIFSFKSNMAMHFYIVPAVVWEALFLPRPVPTSHTKNFTVSTMLFIVYNAFILHTYHQRGLWPYPLFYQVYGTIFYPLFLMIAFLIGVVCYISQWKLTTTVWGNMRKSNGKRKVK